MNRTALKHGAAGVLIGVLATHTIGYHRASERWAQGYGQSNEAVGSRRTATGKRPVEDYAAVYDDRGGAEIQVGATDKVQPCGSDPGVGRRAADALRGGDAEWRSVSFEVSAGSRRLFDAIRQVESSGDDKAVGDGGRSLGPYQMGMDAWQDSGGVPAMYRRAAFDRAHSEAAMLRYWQRYEAVTDEQKARTWNGGPRGMSKAATLPYWAKVRRELKQ